ncbi:MAG: DNA polymerase III subunit, partial [Candidatus Paceibacterota bacterium]
MILGHKRQWEFLKKTVESEKIPHAFLFSGQSNLGKKTIAFELAFLLLGEKNKQHPDLILVEPTEKEIQIAQIRDLNWKLSLKPYSAPFKVAILDQAHLMNSEAQNCLLKTLEEPKGKTVLILIAESPGLLLPTIVSRCENIKFYQVSQEIMQKYLKEQGVSDKEVKEISQISQGRPGVAVDFLANPQAVKDRAEKVKELNNLLKSDLASRFQYAKKISQEPNLKDIMNIWLAYFREELLNSL